MFDFPSSPTNGQQFTPIAGGPTYVWQSPTWKVASGGIKAGVWIGDTPPAAPISGMLWYESDSGNTFIWYPDADGAQWVQFNVAPPVPIVPTFIQKQFIIVSGATTLHGDTTAFLVEVQGGGGGGGNCPAATGASQAQAGCGGGGGGYCSKWIIRPAGYTLSCTIGAGGGSVAAGGNSTFTDSLGNSLTAYGGGAGFTAGPTTAFQTISGAGGGNATGGDINRVGRSGGIGIINGPANVARAGGGGDSEFGTGSLGGGTNLAGGVLAGAAGNGYGSGGSGAFATAGGGTASGGAGMAGCVVITEYR